ncbi:MAG: S8 family serine peptidase [Candidatus Krumholzibacteriota bacterium]|nr:S8 family serine peptidase [Candidatus Krumholzibacteriota bacterium]
MLSTKMYSKLLVYCILGFILVGAAAPAFAEKEGYVPGEVLIKFKDSATTAQRNGVLREMGATLIKEFNYIKVSHYRLNGMTVEEALSRFKGNPHIDIIEPNVNFELAEVPTDPLFSEQWQLHNTLGPPFAPNEDIRAVHAWDVYRGSNEIIVGVIDTYIDVMNPELNARMYRNYGEIPCNGIDDDGNGFKDDYYGLGNQGCNLESPGWHGTGVASVIGAIANDGIGVAGVCQDVSIMQLCGTLTTSSIVTFINYARTYGAHILNMSFYRVTPEWKDVLELACQAAADDGIYMTCSAGNATADIDTALMYPVCLDIDNIIGVTGTNEFAELQYNYGATSVDLAAPYNALCIDPDGGYTLQSGTSFSAPTVAGVLALMMGKYGPDSGMDFKAKLLDTVDHLESLEGKCVSEGRVNAFLALADPDFVAPATIRKVTIKDVASNWVELEWTATGDDGGAGTASAYEFRYSTSPIRNISQFEKASPVESVPDPQPAGSKERFIIDGLEQGTTYYIAFRVFDEWGSYYHRLGGDYSDNVSGITKVKGFTTLGPPAIALEPSSIVAATEKWTLNILPFVIKNNGIGTLDYEIVIPEEYSWITCYPVTGSVQSGNSQSIALYVNVDDLTCGDNSAYVEITSNDLNNPLISLPLELTVSGEARIAVEPESIDFGPCIVGSSTYTLLNITNRGCEILAIMEMKTDHPDYAVEQITVVPPDTTLELIVSFEPSSYGESYSTLTISTLGNEGVETTEIFLSGEGVTPPEVAIFPNELDSPALYTGGTCQKTLTIYNNGGYQLDFILDWGGTPEWIELSPSHGSIAPADSQVVDVTFNALGYCEDQSDTLTLRSTDPESLSIDVPTNMPVIPACHIVTSTNTLDWGSLLFHGFTKPLKIFEVQNLGCEGHQLTVTSIESSNPDVFLMLTDTPFTVDQGESYEVSVTLPLDLPIGTYEGSLTIYSDDPDNPEVGIDLLVTVNAAALLASSAEREVVGESDEPLPLNLRACPNPFNPNTEIRFNLDQPGRVEIRIYDIRGALVNAIDNGHSARGPVSVPWNGSNRRDGKVASGIYFYKLMLDGRQLGDTKKMILLR